MEGVDLSEGMLIEALKKGGPDKGYSRLLAGDNLDIFAPLPQERPSAPIKVELASRIAKEEVLAPPNEESQFDLVVAADVFVYIGDLEPTFKKVAEWLTSNGVFAFSTETHEGLAPYKLNDTGRYTHDPAYIKELGESFCMKLCSSREVVLRMNGGKPVNGHVYILRPNSAAP